jgi:hypothetical protein
MNEAARLLVATLIAAVGLAPIASSRHELTVRHVRCAEHGELTHVQASQGLSVEPPRRFSSVENEGTDRVDGHDHCTNEFLVRGRLVVSIIRSLVRYTPPPAVARDVRDTAVVTPGRAFLLASAPKTSPPSA